MNALPETPETAAPLTPEAAVIAPGASTALTDVPEPAAAEEPAPPAPAEDVAAGAGKAGHTDSWGELAKALFYALLIALVVRTFFFQPYNIPSGSMEGTLLVGDYLFVEKFAYGYSKFSFPWGRLLPSFDRVLERPPHRGDVIVFALPSDSSTVFIKRLIGLPGDRIQMLDGVLYLNDKPVPKVRVADFVEINPDGYEHHVAQYRETLPDGKSYLVLDAIADGPSDNTEVYVVPPGHYFMMGDNRDNSFDSRYFGTVAREQIVGRATGVVLSLNKKNYWPPRWSRTCSSLESKAE